MDSYAVGQQEMAFDMNGMHNGGSNGGYDQFGGDSPPHGDYGYWQNDDMMAGGDGADDGSDPKLRRRIQRACDMCRKKKIKCDGGTPSCKNCINYKTECIFTPMEKKRNPPKGAKYIEALENRLGTMEKVLRLSGILGDDDDKIDLAAIEARFKKSGTAVTTGTDTSKQSDDAAKSTQPAAGTKIEEGTDQSAAKTDGATELTIKNETEVERLSDLMCSLVTNNLGETRFFGSSSGFSIFSPTGIKWVSSKLGDDSFQKCLENMQLEENNWFYWKPEIFGDIFRRQVYTPLPPLPECLSLLKDFFDNFNLIFPLFHEPTFMHLVRRHYSQDPYEGSGWWASLNVALAIAHRLRVMSSVASSEDDVKGWAFLKNALAVLPELTMRNTDLLSIQAIIGMALFLHGTPSPQASFFLIAAALRLAHSIGLHKRGSGFNLNPIEMEQRRRVFWIAYMCDKDISLRSGRPPAQDDDDMNVDLPSEDPEDFVGNIPLADGKSKINLFRLMCRFAIIQSNVYKKLYATKASKQSDGELLNIIGELDKELEDWKESIPIDYRPDHEIKATHTPLIIHVVVLHFAYYNCLTTIHRMSVDHGFWTSRLANYAVQGLNARPLNPRVFSSAAYCVQAARSSIQLLKYIPQGDYACVWMIIYYPVTSLVALFANLLQNSQDVRGRSDLKLMQSVVNFLQMLIAGEGTGSVKRMFNVCFEFTRIARIVLDKNDKDSSKKRKKSEHEEDAEIQPASVAPSLRPSVKENNETDSQAQSSRQTPMETPNKESRVPSASGTESNRPIADPTSQIPSAKSSVVPPDLTPALSQQNLPFNPDLLQTPYDPSLNFSMSSPATQNSNPPIPTGMHMHSFLPGPGDFPNTYTDFSDMEQFGNVSQNIANYAQQYMTPEMWHSLTVPEPLSAQTNSPVPGMGLVDIGYNAAMAGDMNMTSMQQRAYAQPGMMPSNMHMPHPEERNQHHQHLRGHGHPRGNLGHQWGS